MSGSALSVLKPRQNTHKLHRQPVSFSSIMSTNMQPNPQSKHKGLPCVFRRSLRPLVLLHFLSFVHYRSFFQRPPTRPLSSGKQAGAGPVWAFEHVRHQPRRTHPTHQQLESYSRKEGTLAQDMNRQKTAGAHLGNSAAHR